MLVIAIINGRSTYAHIMNIITSTRHTILYIVLLDVKCDWSFTCIVDLLFSSPMSVKTVINTLYANLALKKLPFFLVIFNSLKTLMKLGITKQKYYVCGC